MPYKSTKVKALQLFNASQEDKIYRKQNNEMSGSIMTMSCLFLDQASKRKNTPKIYKNLGQPPQNLIFNSALSKTLKVDG